MRRSRPIRTRPIVTPAISRAGKLDVPLAPNTAEQELVDAVTAMP
jgi:hypothetical protein